MLYASHFYNMYERTSLDLNPKEGMPWCQGTPSLDILI